jgi:hypothetical protein
LNKKIQEIFSWLIKEPVLVGQQPPKYLIQRNNLKKNRFKLINLIDVTGKNDFVADYEIIENKFFIRLRLIGGKWYFGSACVTNNYKVFNACNYPVLMIYMLNILFNDNTFGKTYSIRYDFNDSEIDTDQEKLKKFKLLYSAKEDEEDTYILYHMGVDEPCYIITLDKELFEGCKSWQEKKIN